MRRLRTCSDERDEPFTSIVVFETVIVVPENEI